MLWVRWIDSIVSNSFLLFHRATVYSIDAGSCTPVVSARELGLNIKALTCLMMSNREISTVSGALIFRLGVSVAGSATSEIKTTQVPGEVWPVTFAITITSSFAYWRSGVKAGSFTAVDD